MRRRQIYSIEFEDKSVYVGLSVDAKRRYHQHNSPSKPLSNKINSVPNKLIIHTCLLEEGEAQARESEILDEYIRNKWNPLNKNKAGQLGGSTKLTRWDLRSILEKLKFCKSIGDVRVEHPSLYDFIHRNNLTYIFDLYNLRKKRRNFWNREKVFSTSKKYKKIYHYKKEHPGAITAARNGGYYKELSASFGGDVSQ